MKGDFFPGSSNSVTEALIGLGYDARDIAVTVQPSQRAWAQEHSVAYRQRKWVADIAWAQVRYFRPEVLMVDPYAVSPGWLQTVRADGGVRLVICRHSSPRSDLSRFRLADIVVTGDSDQVAALRSAGIRAELLHHAFDDRVLNKLPERETSSSLIFSGQVLPRVGFHLYRMEVLEAFQQSALPLEIHLLRNETTLRDRMVERLRHPSRRNRSDQLPPEIVSSSKPPVFGLEMLRLLRSAGVTLNIHGDVSVNNANNLRLWEATGVGSCLLTDDKSNLGQLFDRDREIVTFRSPEEAVEKARWLIGYPREARAIAEAGQQKTLADHIYARRVVELDDIIRHGG